MQVVFAFPKYLSRHEFVLHRCHRCLLALQDSKGTIIMQKIADTMSLG